MKKIGLFIIVLLIGESCVEKVDFNGAETASQLVIDGQINDAPGPYTIKLSRTRKILDYTAPKVVSASKVMISDNLGNSEILTEVTQGTYKTNAAGIRGVIGREYVLRVETRDGNIYESSKEKLSPAGAVDSIYYTFEQYQPPSGGPKYQFRIFINSRGEALSENLYRWKFTGTYKVQTNPELHTKLIGQDRVADPRPCSGYGSKDGTIVQINPCECCTCYVNLIDTNPKVSDNALVSNGNFKNVEVGIVPVEYWIFYEKVQVEVEQISLSTAAFNYWKTVADQKQGAASLFQPSIGKAVTNMRLVSGTQEAQGLFSAAASTKKYIFLDGSNIPIGADFIPSAPPPIPESCLSVFPFSSTVKPATW